MRATRSWRVTVFVGEDEGRTYAEAELYDDIGNHLRGTGKTQLHPGDADVPEIGDEVAAGRALVDLGRRLLATAEQDIESVTHEPARVSSTPAEHLQHRATRRAP
jgi:hypothetical protein